VPENNTIDLVVVVSGRPEPVRAHPNEKVVDVVRTALRESGNQGQPPENWELRTEQGVVISQDQTVREAGLLSGMTLFLNPEAGAGG